MIIASAKIGWSTIFWTRKIPLMEILLRVIGTPVRADSCSHPPLFIVMPARPDRTDTAGQSKFALVPGLL
jgi:hypothetical protein